MVSLRILAMLKNLRENRSLQIESRRACPELVEGERLRVGQDEPGQTETGLLVSVGAPCFSRGSDASASRKESHFDQSGFSPGFLCESRALGAV